MLGREMKLNAFSSTVKYFCGLGKDILEAKSYLEDQ